MSSPLVSIIISAYNAERHIAETLESVLSQTWPNVEIIVVNDGSADNTLAIVEKYTTRGIKIISQENKGQDAALNNGYRQATGDYIKFMDSDDLINPEMITLQMAALNRSKEYVAYGEWARFFNDPSVADFVKLDYWRDMNPIDFLTARPEGIMLQCGIMLVPRQLIEKAGLWDERLILFNDTEFFTRILLVSKGIKFSAGAKLFYRSGQSNSISAGRTRKYFESTFLATKLIAEKLLNIEDSIRVRSLISNMFMSQYGQFYPRFPDLGNLHEEQIEFFGHCTLKSDGGQISKILTWAFGWKKAKRIQTFVYGMGYTKLMKKNSKHILMHKKVR